MLFLPFQIGNELYAIDCKYVTEVVPYVKLKKIPHVPDYVSGLLNLNGLPIAVIDLCQLVTERPAMNCLHTRIVILNLIKESGESLHLGVIGEKITQTINREKSAFVNSGIKVKDLSFLGGISNEKKYSIQLIDVEELFKLMQGTLFK